MAEAWTVIGVGNPMRGDDGVGAVVAKRVRGMPGVEHVIDDGDPFEVADLVQGGRRVLLLDATRGGGVPGVVTVWEPRPGGASRPQVGASSHGFGADAAIELAAALGTLPDRVVVVGIEGERFEGTGLSEAVAAAVDEAVAAVEAVVSDA
ncbi:MAG TPA: hydrogenase maturation protease [Actinobacteria bacterium]|nr:hydrogenase maturation protease [Actinomycetota bacterium]